MGATGYSVCGGRTGRRRERGWLVGVFALVLVGLSAGPARAVTFAQQTLPFTGLSSPTLGVAVDSAGDTFASDHNNNAVVELTAGGSQHTLAFTGLNGPNGVAVDSTGDVFVTDGGNSRVLELPAGGTQQTLPFTGLSDPWGVAVDAAGDVFVTSFFSNSAVELPAAGPQVTLAFSGLHFPDGIAVDAAGDVFVSNNNTSNYVVELPAGGSQQTLPFTGLIIPSGVAVDAAGDVFVTAQNNPAVVELPAGGSQQTLPFTGLNTPDGAAVDAAGDVFIGNSSGTGAVVELSPSVPSGSLSLAPGSGPAGSQIGVGSVTPCPLPGAFGSTSATVALYSPVGTVLASVNVTLDQAGDWSGALTVPPATADGSYFVRARCRDAEKVVSQQYAAGVFVVAAPSLGATGPAGPTGPTGSQGPAGTNGTAGAPGPAGTTGAAGPQGSTGPQGAAGPAALSPIKSTSTCKTKRSTTTCKVTFTYARTRAVDGEVLATAKLHGRTETIGRGRVHDDKLVLRMTFRHVRRGRYAVTLREQTARGNSIVIGHTTVYVT